MARTSETPDPRTRQLKRVNGLDVFAYGLGRETTYGVSNRDGYVLGWFDTLPEACAYARQP